MEALEWELTGVIQNKTGQKLFPGFTVPSNTTHINVAENGTIEAFIQGQIEPTNLGQIPVFTFNNPTGLKSLGGNNYAATVGSGLPNQLLAGQENAGTIQQGMLESSNVNLMVEMTDLIKAQRAYEMNSKVMGVADQMLQTVNNLK
jgi:flagellar basal-body rod protein FlgG